MIDNLVGVYSVEVFACIRYPDIEAGSFVYWPIVVSRFIVFFSFYSSLEFNDPRDKLVPVRIVEFGLLMQLLICVFVLWCGEHWYD